MRKIRNRWFAGNGGVSMQEVDSLKAQLDKALETISGMQQPPRYCDPPPEASNEYDKRCRKGEREVTDIAKGIYCALTGREVVKDRKAER